MVDKQCTVAFNSIKSMGSSPYKVRLTSRDFLGVDGSWSMEMKSVGKEKVKPGNNILGVREMTRGSVQRACTSTVLSLG